jgi:hypothetical protein
MTTTAFSKEVIKENGIGDELTTVRGIVIPVDWNDEGNALAVAILGAGEEEHFVEQDEEGKKLLKLMQQEVEVSGTVTEAIQGHKVITVKSHGLKMGGDW